MTTREKATRSLRLVEQVLGEQPDQLQAPVAALVEMSVQGVSTCKVKAITEEPYPYLVLDARYEKVRLDGVIRSQAVLIAIGINWEGRRNVPGVELAQRKSTSSWIDFLTGLKARGQHGVELVVADDHAGLRRAIADLLPEAAYQRCYVHFPRNVLDYLPRKADDDCLKQLRWINDRRNLAEAFTFYRLPRQHHKHLKSTNLRERLNEEIGRRTCVVRIFPNEADCLRPVRALRAEIHESWIEDHRYLDMTPLKEQKREQLRAAA
jgi:transposase-like protein